MTVIAYKAGVMAADTEGRFEDIPFQMSDEKVGKASFDFDGKTVDVVFGSAGSSAICRRYRNLMKRFARRINGHTSNKVWSFEDAVESHLENVYDELKAGDKDFESVAVFSLEPAKIWSIDEDGVSLSHAKYWSVGSGAHIAMGAMYAGSSPEGAVSAAIAHSDTCGGCATVVKFETTNPTEKETL